MSNWKEIIDRIVTVIFILTIAVGSPPEIIEPLLDMLVVAPEEAHLECDIFPGDPPAKLQWYKNDRELRSGKKYDISYLDEVAALEIHETDAKDSGWYRCEAANKLGRVETHCTLIVQCKWLVICSMIGRCFLYNPVIVLLS